MSQPTLQEPANLSELFTAAKPELEAVAASALARRLVSAERVLELTTRLLSSWAKVEARAATLIKAVHLAAYQQRASRLEGRAWVFYRAALDLGAIYSDDARRQRDALAARVREHDAELIVWARACFHGDAQASETLADIARHHGRRDDADDVLRLVGMFRHGAKLGLELPIGDAQLDAAEADAKQQLDLLSTQLGSAARDLVARAYTLWYEDYSELMVFGRFLTRADANSHALFPGVRMPGSRRTVTDPSEAEAPELPVEDDEDEAPAPEAGTEAEAIAS